MYERFYGLSGNPFLLTPDARFFYPSKIHKRALSFLRYGVNKGEGFVVITGGVGTGKTTLVQTLLSSLREQPIVVANVVTTQLDDQELVRIVAAELGLRYRELSKAELLKGLEAYLRDAARNRKRVLLIVDEAQNLPADSIEELRMLSNMQFQGRPLLQTFLLGQDQLRRRISGTEFEQLRQRITAVFHLGPLDSDETKEYVEHRLRCVGWTGDPEIHIAAYLDIHRFTEGVPRRINSMCDRLLLYGMLEELHVIDESAVRAVADDLQEEFSALQGDGSSSTGLTPRETSRLEAGAEPAGDDGMRPLPMAVGAADVGSSELVAAVRELTAVLRGELGAVRTALERLAGSIPAAPPVAPVAPATQASPPEAAQAAGPDTPPETSARSAQADP